MGIVAAFDKVLFFNPASKYSILRLKTANEMVPEDARDTYKFSDHLIRFVAVGYDLPQTGSIQMDLEGDWIVGKHGKQFEVKQWHEVIPPTIEGIRSYLSSGLLRGIGPKTADAIVQTFGMKSLDVIENHPERLLEIRGITEERLGEIKAGYAESKATRELMILLSPFKVTPATAMKIYQFFGPGGVPLLQKSAFYLCQIPGFGFKRVDAIVRKSGGDLQDPMRIQGALFYSLEKARTEKCHLFIDAPTLMRDSTALLNAAVINPQNRIAAADVQRELTNMILNNVVVSTEGNIYLPHVFAQESETACKVVKMLLERPEPVNIAPTMEQVKATLGIRLTKKQTESVEMVFRHNISIITGGPGTGKSTVLKAIVNAYQLLYPKNRIALAAPTGKASRRMAETSGIEDAQTIHSLLKLHGEDAGWQRKGDLDAQFVIIDESSMIDMWLAHQLFTRLRDGTKLLFVGDADQLESVGPGSVFAQMIESGIIPVTTLHEIFRQAEDSRIAYNAKFVKEQNGNLLYGNDFAFMQADSQDEAAHIICTLYRRELETTPIEQVQILTPFRSNGDASANSLNLAIRDAINPASPNKPETDFGGKLFRLYDRVMQTKNDYDMSLCDAHGKEIGVGVFNGDVGTITEIGAGTLTVDFDGRFATYAFEDLDKLDLAYANTIHKAQGSEYDVVIIPVLPAHKILLTLNLFYTAITRAKRRVILVGQKRAIYIAVHKSGKGKRNTLLAERIRLYYRALTASAETDGGSMKKAS